MVERSACRASPDRARRSSSIYPAISRSSQTPYRPALRPCKGETALPSKAHLLIVDDDANTLASLARAFRLGGHEATVCDNAAKALELAKTQNFDLIFSDVVMPGKHGLSL